MTSCSSDIRADQPTPCSHTLQSISCRPLTDVSKIGWSFTSILQVQMKGFEPPTTPPQTEGSTKLSYIWLIMLHKEATGVAGIEPATT